MNRWVDKEVIRFLNKVGKRISKGTGYTYKSLRAMHPNDKDYDVCAGTCLVGTEEIRITTVTHTGRLHSIEYLIDTLIHEMAHCGQPEEPPEHGKWWRERYDYLKWWVDNNIY